MGVGYASEEVLSTKLGTYIAGVAIGIHNITEGLAVTIHLSKYQEIVYSYFFHKLTTANGCYSWWDYFLVFSNAHDRFDGVCSRSYDFLDFTGAYSLYIGF